ncbi:hypothetical protein CEV34_3024 [Brucella pseudogrignonensis]|uniref:Uncharacterized protein n=1 Tax=Brucella pseudogrignonensis TaxID=419475 RepID=A0A256GDU3_9HYPH|nr:hypothetical protein CEV34_3024 [Brucella pseudogrignonensis]
MQLNLPTVHLHALKRTCDGIIQAIANHSIFATRCIERVARRIRYELIKFADIRSETR